MFIYHLCQRDAQRSLPTGLQFAPAFVRLALLHPALQSLESHCFRSCLLLQMVLCHLSDFKLSYLHGNHSQFFN